MIDMPFPESCKFNRKSVYRSTSNRFIDSVVFVNLKAKSFETNVNDKSIRKPIFIEQKIHLIFNLYLNYVFHSAWTAFHYQVFHFKSFRCKKFFPFIFVLFYFSFISFQSFLYYKSIFIRKTCMKPKNDDSYIIN